MMKNGLEQELEYLWGNLLSQQPDLIKSTFAMLSSKEKNTIIEHLHNMAENKGWQPSQQQSARIALQVIKEIR